MELVEKLRKLKELGYTFVYSKAGGVIGSPSTGTVDKFIAIYKDIDMVELERKSDDVLNNHNRSVFDLLEKEKMILYI